MRKREQGNVECNFRDLSWLHFSKERRKMHVNSSSHFLWPRRKSFSPLSFVREVLVPSFFVKKCPSPSYFVKKKSFHSLFGEKCMPLRFCQKKILGYPFSRKLLAPSSSEPTNHSINFGLSLTDYIFFGSSWATGLGKDYFHRLGREQNLLKPGPGNQIFRGLKKVSAPWFFLSKKLSAPWFSPLKKLSTPWSFP